MTTSKRSFFYHIQSSDHNGFLKDTDITFLDKTDPSNASSREDFWIRTLKTRYHLTLTQTHIVSECFRIFTSHYCIYEKRNFFIIWKKQGTWEVARYAYLFIYLFIYQYHYYYYNYHFIIITVITTFFTIINIYYIHIIVFYFYFIFFISFRELFQVLIRELLLIFFS